LLQLYGGAVVAYAALDASREAETSAQQTAAAALARHQAQVGNQIDRLQAQTASAQATLERVRALGQWNNRRGELALALGADIGQPLMLADWEVWALQPMEAPDLLRLQNEAKARHPRVLAVQARLEALRSRLNALRAESKGAVTLSASAGNSRNMGSAGGGNIPTVNVAVAANIPLFNRRETDAQLRQLLAQLEAREAEAEIIHRELDNQLWQAHFALLTSQQSLLASERLLESSLATFQVAQGRYKAGVGGLQDLLNAQTALADARRERVASLVAQLNARTYLSLATGRLGPGSLKAPNVSLTKP
jgi:outer membrane protein